MEQFSPFEVAALLLAPALAVVALAYISWRAKSDPIEGGDGPLAHSVAAPAPASAGPERGETAQFEVETHTTQPPLRLHEDVDAGSSSSFQGMHVLVLDHEGMVVGASDVDPPPAKSATSGWMANKDFLARVARLESLVAGVGARATSGNDTIPARKARRSSTTKSSGS